MQRPFLSYFAREREDAKYDNTTYYDENLDMNLPVNNRVSPDLILCSTQTFTEVKGESTDKDVSEYAYICATETYTKVKSEQPDNDVTEL